MEDCCAGWWSKKDTDFIDEVRQTMLRFFEAMYSGQPPGWKAGLFVFFCAWALQVHMLVPCWGLAIRTTYMPASMQCWWQSKHPKMALSLWRWGWMKATSLRRWFKSWSGWGSRWNTTLWIPGSEEPSKWRMHWIWPSSGRPTFGLFERQGMRQVGCWRMKVWILFSLMLSILSNMSACTWRSFGPRRRTVVFLLTVVFGESNGWWDEQCDFPKKACHKNHQTSNNWIIPLKHVFFFGVSHRLNISFFLFTPQHLRFSNADQVKPGGLLAGHDFAPEKPQRFPGPFLAAKAFARTGIGPKLKEHRMPRVGGGKHNQKSSENFEKYEVLKKRRCMVWWRKNTGL